MNIGRRLADKREKRKVGRNYSLYFFGLAFDLRVGSEEQYGFKKRGRHMLQLNCGREEGSLCDYPIHILPS
jgi:hypothetical protein